jgi:hypothetical protein
MKTVYRSRTAEHIDNGDGEPLCYASESAKDRMNRDGWREATFEQFTGRDLCRHCIRELDHCPACGVRWHSADRLVAHLDQDHSEVAV